MEYKIVTVTEDYYKDASRGMEKEVKKYINEGYKPLGGISVSTLKVGYGHVIVMAQALVKD